MRFNINESFMTCGLNEFAHLGQWFNIREILEFQVLRYIHLFTFIFIFKFIAISIFKFTFVLTSRFMLQHNAEEMMLLMINQTASILVVSNKYILADAAVIFPHASFCFSTPYDLFTILTLSNIRSRVESPYDIWSLILAEVFNCVAHTSGHHIFICCIRGSCFITLHKHVIVWMFNYHTYGIQTYVMDQSIKWAFNLNLIFYPLLISLLSVYKRFTGTGLPSVQSFLRGLFMLGLARRSFTCAQNVRFVITRWSVLANNLFPDV